MDFLTLFNRGNSDYLEILYSKYQEDAASVEPEWQAFFAGFELGLGRPLPQKLGGDGEFATLSQRRSDGTGDLVHSYRALGHFVSNLDPLGDRRLAHPLLNLAEFGFSSTVDLDRQVGSGGFLGKTDGTLRDLVAKLQDTYCGTVGVEFMDIPDKEQRDWLLERIEPLSNRTAFSAAEGRQILAELIAAEEFERFLHTKYLGQKRFSLEGGEALVPLLNAVIEHGADKGIEEIVMGMAHRGRLNILTHILGKPYEYIFTEFEGSLSQEEAEGDGDVKYHKGFSRDRKTPSGKTVHTSMSANPSHLELVDPVVEGVVRAKQTRSGDINQTKVVPVLIHGEAAFVGQGIVTETLNLSELECYRTGGTIHVIINNQVGFTATAKETRFTPYPTDIAKAIHAPIFHVNADDPEAVVHTARLAVEFRQQFKVDVLIDLWCYRRYGHNETDDPTFTQPLMYDKIAKKETVVEVYSKRLIAEGKISEGDVEAIRAEARGKMENSLTIAREKHPYEKGFSFKGLWQGMTRAGSDWTASTRVSAEVIQNVTEKATSIPQGFHIHRKLQKLIETRREMAAGVKAVDWGCAEMWSMGTLLQGGTSVRLAGQDSGRGTFSHRHCTWYDVETNERYVALEHLGEGGAKFTVVNTMLSELAVLGFEYGYSSADPKNLVVWEAQFGDFVNGAQPIIDQFIVSSESKWQRMSGIVLLLPHGYEGQGPEHSSARLERFLQLCAENNIQVCYPTTPAQYFHLLRRQIMRNFRKPLILMMPKSLLRDDRSASPLSAFTERDFELVIDDDKVQDPKAVERVLLCSGKVFFALDAKRAEVKEPHALLRVEQLYPFPQERLVESLKRFPNAKEIVWVQEEAENNGAWNFLIPRLQAVLPKGTTLRYCGRDEGASPATGNYKWHAKEEEKLLNEAFNLK